MAIINLVFEPDTSFDGDFILSFDDSSDDNIVITGKQASMFHIIRELEPDYYPFEVPCSCYNKQAIKWFSRFSYNCCFLKEPIVLNIEKLHMILNKKSPTLLDIGYPSWAVEMFDELDIYTKCLYLEEASSLRFNAGIYSIAGAIAFYITQLSPDILSKTFNKSRNFTSVELKSLRYQASWIEDKDPTIRGRKPIIPFDSSLSSMMRHPNIDEVASDLYRGFNILSFDNLALIIKLI